MLCTVTLTCSPTHQGVDAQSYTWTWTHLYLDPATEPDRAHRRTGRHTDTLLHTARPGTGRHAHRVVSGCAWEAQPGFWVCSCIQGCSPFLIRTWPVPSITHSRSIGFNAIVADSELEGSRTRATRKRRGIGLSREQLCTLRTPPPERLLLYG